MSKSNFKVDELTIEGVVYVPKDSVKEPLADSDVKIVVLQRGWVVVGKYKRTGDQAELNPSAVIRTWGTTKGLPELVNGPLSQTKLDKCETITRFNIGSEICMFDAVARKWENHI